MSYMATFKTKVEVGIPRQVYLNGKPVFLCKKPKDVRNLKFFVQAAVYAGDEYFCKILDNIIITMI